MKAGDKVYVYNCPLFYTGEIVEVLDYGGYKVKSRGEVLCYTSQNIFTLSPHGREQLTAEMEEDIHFLKTNIEKLEVGDE